MYWNSWNFPHNKVYEISDSISDHSISVLCHISVIQKSIMLQVDSLCVVEPMTVSSSTFFLMWNQNVWLNCKAELVFLFCILHFVSFTKQMLLCSGFSLSKSQGTLKTMMTVIFSTFQSMSGAILKGGREGGSSVK